MLISTNPKEPHQYDCKYLKKLMLMTTNIIHNEKSI